MEEKILIALLTIVLFTCLGRKLIRAIGDLTPGGAVLLTSSLYVFGAAIVHWREGGDASILVYSVSAALFSVYLLVYFGSASLFHLQLNAPSPVQHRSVDSRHFMAAKWGFLVVSVVGVILVIFFTRTDRLLAALYQFIFLGEIDAPVFDLRIELTSDEYLWVAPGYAKQLRDILLPLAALLVLFTIRRNSRRFMALALGVLPLVSLSMISSGERGPVLLFLIAAAYATARAVRGRFHSARVVLVPLGIVVIIAFGTFLALTSTRTTLEYEDASLASIFADRVVTRLPEENVYGAPVWSRGVPIPGIGWLSELSMILPGRQETLSNLIHEYLGGGDKGNSVLGMWVDVYYNFGFWLGITASAMIGLFMALFTHWVNVRREASLSADICGLWLSVSMLMVFSPFGFLLYGPFVLSVCLWVITRASKPRFNSMKLSPQAVS